MGEAVGIAVGRGGGSRSGAFFGGLFGAFFGGRRRLLLGFGVVTLALCIQHRGILAGRVLFFEDVAAFFEPLWTAVARQMRSGSLLRRLATWAPQAWSGQPLLGDPQLGVLYPPHWLWCWAEPLRAYAWSVVAHSLLAAGGAYALARALGRSHAAAATGAIALSLSAYFVLEARHLMFLVSAAWVPWLMLAIARCARTGSGGSHVAIAASLAMALLGGGWSMLVFAAPVVALFTIARLRTSTSIASAWRRALSIGLGLALGVGLAAVQLLPAYAHLQLSPRALPLDASFAGSYAWPSWRYIITLVLPLWYGDDARGNYVGAPDQWELCGYGSGLVAALLALSSLTRRRGRGERLLYLALIGLAVLAALGPAGPLWSVLRTLPLVGRTRCPARALFVYTLLLPLLTAAGVDRLRAALPRSWRGVVWLLPLLVAGELLIGFRAENPSVPLAETRIAPEVLAAVPRATETPWGRCLFDVHLGQAFHNGGLRWDLESPGGYSSLPLWRYLHLLWIANHRAVYPGWPRPQLAHDLSAQGLWTLDSPLVDLLNVRWLVAPADHPPAGSGWILVQRGQDSIDLWRNDEALPRAFVVHRAIEVADEAQSAIALAARGFVPAREVLVEEPVSIDSHDAPPTEARVLSRGASEARFAVEGDAAGVLVFSTPYEPSWQVYVDGSRARLLRVDYALMGVRVRAGTHEIRFVRLDGPLQRGAILSLVALAFVLALAAVTGREGARW